MSTRPNILYIFTDQQSADAMSCTGHDELATPHMDSLAAQGTRFTRAYCTYPLCTPSRASMFTGRYPHEVGITKNSQGIDDNCRAQELGRVMRDAGYDCAYGGKWHVPQISLPDDGEHGFETICPFEDNHLPKACIDFMRRERDNPFFLVASFDNPHNICEYGRYNEAPWECLPDEPPIAEMPNLPANFGRSPYESAVIRKWRSASPKFTMFDDFTPDQWRRYRWGYNRLTEIVDRRIGVILAGLRDLKLEEDTLVVFSSDHGDHQGAHGLGQKWTFYEESCRVPLIISWKGHTAAGRTDSRLASNGLDLFPTLCDFAGVMIPDHLAGLSLRAATEGKTDGSWRDHLVGESLFDNIQTPLRMVRTEQYKYIAHDWGPYREQLFDLDNDPGEMVNLAVEKRFRSVVQAHRDLLAQWCADTGDHFGKHYAHPHESFILPGTDFGKDFSHA